MNRTTFIYTDVGDDYGRVEYVQHMGSDQTIIDAARVSFAQDKSRWRPEADPKLLRYLIKNEHWSPLEHTSITWHVVVPLFVRSQWHRHRSASYNEVSRRYTSEDIRFYTPTHFRAQATSNKQASEWSTSINRDIIDPCSGLTHTSSYTLITWGERALSLYEELLNSGVCREQARMVLPQNMYTRFYATMNLRNALAFIKLREDNHSQWEIYVAAKAMSEQLSQLFPEAWKAWKEVNEG